MRPAFVRIWDCPGEKPPLQTPVAKGVAARSDRLAYTQIEWLIQCRPTIFNTGLLSRLGLNVAEKIHCGRGNFVGDCALRKWRQVLKRWSFLRRFRLLHLEFRNRYRGLPRWTVLKKTAVNEWSEAQAAAKGPKVLVATSVGAHMVANTLDSVLAVALTLRGARPHALLCDRALPACLACEMTWWPDQAHFIAYGPSRTLCGACFRPARSMWSSLGLPIQLIGAHVSEEERAAAWQLANATPATELDRLEHLGVRVGMHARAAALRYLAIGNFEVDPDSLPVRRRFLAAALIATTALDRLLVQERYDVCIAHHGLYVPQGLLVDLTRKHGVRLVTWNISYRSGSFVFSHDDTYHFTLIQEPTEAWETMPWPPALQRALDTYMRSRAVGSHDWVSYHDGTGGSLVELKETANIDPNKPTITAYTNVLWDAQVLYPSNAFPSMLDWLLETINYFERRPELQLVIRVHPAEVQNPVRSRETVVGELARLRPHLPSNVFVIPPTANADSYAIASQCNAAIIYGTKMGVELAYMGVPTIVAGESWVRNKGITLDATSRGEYFALLDRLPFDHGLDQDQKLRAARYAFHFFFRRTIPLEFLTIHKGAWPPFELDLADLRSLRRGGSAGLDIVCDGILSGTPFIYPAEDAITQGKSSH